MLDLCQKKGSETIARTHADPLSPPEPPPKCITPHDVMCVPHFNISETTDKHTPLDIETRNDVMWEIVGEVPLLDSPVGAWSESCDPSALVHIYRQVDELYTSHSPSVISNGALVKSKVRKTM